MAHPLLFVNQTGTRRPLGYLEEDKAALRAILQACVDVELFTIPLYMTSLYSIQGTHAINSRGNDFYKGRLWPGMGLTAQPTTANGKAFNAVFSVFVAEMLHLQLASNMCNAAGFTPSFTSPALVYQPGEKSTPDGKEHAYGWRCYGPNVTLLPNILDFKDTLKPQMRVNVGPLNKTQTELFLVIEETGEDAKHLFKGGVLPPAYESSVPFKSWSADPRTAKLPLFSSIGCMYTRLWEYLSIEYDQRKPSTAAGGGVEYMQLWDYVYADTQNTKPPFQREVFNTEPKNQYEYPAMTTRITQVDADKQLAQIMKMINGITDQGEGRGVIKKIKERLLREHAATGKDVQPLLTQVEERYQPSRENLKRKYPSYNENGKPLPESAQANARAFYRSDEIGNGAMDHYEIFSKIMDMLKKPGPQPEDRITTWADWHADPSNEWTASMLEVANEQKNHEAELPDPSVIARALNNLKRSDADGKNFALFSHTAAGAIAGVTTVLDKYFNRKSTKTEFPYPSMSGSGDRMGICWAIFGRAPELWLGTLPRTQPGVPDNQVLFHACQGMSLIGQDDPASCASTPIFHTCKSSNLCKTEGGCGFVQSISGCGGGCGSSKGFLHSHNAPAAGESPNPSSPEAVYSTPANNNCAGLGGCAVPISASQMYPAIIPKAGAPPTANLMQINGFTEDPPYTATELDKVAYATNQRVYDVAWDAFARAMKARGQEPGEKPEPSELRLAFPPST